MSKKNLTWAAISVTAVLSGCALAPGPSLDSSRMNDDLSKPVDSTKYDVQLITPQLIQTQKELQAADARTRERGVTTGLPEAPTDYRVGINDVLGITIYGHPELTGGGGAGAAPLPEAGTLQGQGGIGGGAPPSAFSTGGAGEVDTQGQRVAADGTIFFPTLGRVHVAGKSPLEISRLLYDRLKGRLKDPQIDVRVVAYRSQQVQVTGDVKAPGQLSLTGTPLRLVDAITRAGGGNPDADLQRVLVSRNGQTTSIDVNRILLRGDMKQNIVLQNGDIVNVPNNTPNRVFVMGEVTKVQTLFMNNGQLTLADAVANVNGLDVRGANPRQILIVRHPNPPLVPGDRPGVQSGLEEGLKRESYKPEDNKPEIYRLDMTQVDSFMLATQFDLHPLDVVYVGTAPAARFNRLLEQVLPSIQSIYLLYLVAHNNGNN